MSWVILSDPRLMPGHSLIIPKRHVERLVELQLDEQLDVARLTVRMQERVLVAGATGCDIRQHYRPFIPQGKIKVNHLHVHIQPRYLEDELFQKAEKFERELFTPLETAELAEWREKLS